MKQPKTGGEKPKKKPGRKSKKDRQNVSLSDPLLAWADNMAELTFGNRTAYLSHLILNDMKAHNLTLEQMLKLAQEWHEKHGR